MSVVGLLVNGQGDFSLACNNSALQNISSNENIPGYEYGTNPLVLDAAQRVIEVKPFYTDGTFVNIEGIALVVEGIEGTSFYCYGICTSGLIWLWQSSASNQELIGFRNSLPSINGGNVARRLIEEGTNQNFTEPGGTSGGTGGTNQTYCQQNGGFSIYVRPLASSPCATESINAIDVSCFDLQNLTLVTGAAQTHTLSHTTLGGQTCNVEYQLRVTGPQPSLITLSGNTVTFHASDSLADAGDYQISVIAQIVGQTTWSAATLATFKYINPCLTATYQATGCPTSFTVNVGTIFNSPTFPLWLDSVTSAISNGTIICPQSSDKEITKTFGGSDSMLTKFSYHESSSTYTTGTRSIGAAPTLSTEVGEYRYKLYSCLNAPNLNPCNWCAIQVFVTEVTDPCNGAIVTASSVSPISVTVYQASAAYSPFTEFTHVYGDDEHDCGGGMTYSATLALGTATTTLTTFSLNSGTSGFQVYSGNLNQVGTHIATLTGALTSYPTQKASTTFTITVLNPCDTTTLTASPPTLTAMVYSVSQVAISTQQSPSFSDAVSSSQSQTLTICGGLTYSISDSPSGGATALTSSELTVSSSGLITVFTTNAAAVGSHTATLLVKLTNYQTVTLSLTMQITISACQVTAAQVYQAIPPATPAALTQQFYTTNQPNGFSLQLSIVQTPACGYTVNGWGVQSIGVSGGCDPNHFETIDATSGLYTIVASLDQLCEGEFSVIVTSVSINGAQWQSLLTTPKQFGMTVSSNSQNSPCATTTVQPTTIPNVSIKVWEGSPSTIYNTFANYLDTASTAANSPGMCQISYTASISTSSTGYSLTIFSYSAQKFNIYSDNRLQIGSYTVTVVGTVTQYPTRTASTTFTITVQEPCQSTTLTTSPASFNPMSYSVSQTAACTQQVHNTNDAVSSSLSQTLTVCGGVTYSISDSTASGITALTTTELTVDSSGLISVSTTNAATIGLHTATLLIKLTNYPSVTLSLPMTVTITACVVTSAQVYQSSTSATPAALVNKHYQIQPTVGYTLQFSIIQTPACGYTVSAWSISSVGTSGTHPQCCNVVDTSTGVYTIPPNLDQTWAGEYIISITGVKINNFEWISQLTGPKTFYLTVTSTNTPCVPTSVKILQSNPSGILTAQTWTISTTTQFTYQLTVDTTTTCGFSPTAWTVTTVSNSNNPNAVTSLQTISSQGLFSVGPFTDYATMGIYNVSVTSLTISGVAYGSTSITNTIASPNSFLLNVNNPCASATITASQIANYSILAYAILSINFDSFTYVDSNGLSNQCGGFTYTVIQTLGTSTVAISTLNINSAQQQIVIQSQSISQVGTHNINLIGALSLFTTVTATKTFVVTVSNPCEQTSIIADSALTSMSYSVAQIASCTQQAGAFNDAVDDGQGLTLTICGGVTYLISDTSDSGVTPLSSTELTVSGSGLITVSTSNSATVGVHTISLNVKLTTYPNVTLTQTFTLTISSCVITSAQVVQNSAPLADKTYQLSATTGLAYQLSIVQTPECGYPVSGWAVQAQGITGTQPANFQTITPAGVYTIAATQTQSQSGTYTIQITGVQINGIEWGNSLTAPSSFILTVQAPCATTVVTPTTFNPVTLAVWEGSATIPYNNFVGFSDSASTNEGTPGLCAISYAASVTNNGGGYSLTTFSFTPLYFNIYSDQMDQRGTYTVTVTGTVTQFPSQLASTTFAIIITDPCLTTSLSTNGSLTPMNYSVSQSTSCTQQAPQFNTAVDIAQSQTLLICGTVSYSIADSAPAGVSGLTALQLTVDANGLITVSTTNPSTTGVHTVILTVQLASYTSVTTSLSTTLTIACPVTSITPDYTLPSTVQTVQILDSVGLQLPLPIFTQTPACGITPNYVLTGNPDTNTGFVSQPFFTLTTLLLVQTNDLSLHGKSFTLKLETTIGTVVDSQTFSVTFVNPCISASFNVNSLQGMTTSVNVSPSLAPQTIDPSTVNVAATVNCGAISYALDQVLSFVILDTTAMTITVVSTNNLDVGTHNLQIQVSVSGYPNLVQNLPFTVVIEPCVLISIAALSNRLNPSLTTPVTIFDTVGLQQSLPTYSQTPACGYPPIYTLTADTLTPSFGQISQPFLTQPTATTFQVKSSDYTLDNKQYVIQIEAKIGLLSNTQTTNIQFSDPCAATQFITQSIPNLVGFITQALSSTTVVLPILSDTVNSTTYPSASQISSCFTQQITLTSNSLPIPFMNQTVNLSGNTVLNFATNDANQVGVHQISVLYQLTRYPLISTTINFNLTMYLITMPTQVQNQNYIIGNLPLKVSMGQITITPNDPNFTLSYSANQANSSAIPSFILGTLTLSGYEFSISTTSSQNVGVYQIQLQTTINNTQANQAIVVQQYFNLTVTQVVVAAPLVPPIFNETITQNFSIIVGSAWNYTLPVAINPYDSTDKVVVSVTFSPLATFVQFSERVFKIGQGITTAQNIGVYIANIKLTTSINTTASYKVTLNIVSSQSQSNNQEILTVSSQQSFNTSAQDANITQNKELDNRTSQLSSNKLVQVDGFDWQAAFDKAQRKSQGRQKTERPPPNATITEVSTFGVVTIKFTGSMVVPPLEMIQNATVYLQDDAKTQLPAILLTIVPSVYSSPENLTMNYSISSYTESSLTIQIKFDNPSIVSSKAPDQVKLVFVGNQFFFDIFGRQIQQSLELKKHLPKQMSGSMNPALLAATAAAQTATSAILASNFVVNLLLSASLSQLWGMINTQQVVVMLPLFDVQMPPNAASFFGFVMDLAAFNLIPVQAFYDIYLPPPTTDGPMNENFDKIGFGSMYFLNNLGPMILGILSLPVMMAMLYIFKYFRNFSKRIHKIYTNLENTMFWQHPITLTNETFWMVCLCTFVNSRIISFENLNDTVNSSLAILFLVVCTLMPFLTTIFLFFKYPVLDQPNMRKKYGLLYEGLDLRSGKVVLLSNFIFLFRRYLLGVTVVFQKHLILQVYISIFGSVVSLILVGFCDALLEKKATYNEYLNESMIMLSLYTFMCFSDFVPDPVMQMNIGYASCMLVLAHLGYNISAMTGTSIFQLTQQIKRWCAKRNSNNKRVSNAIVRESQSTDQLQQNKRKPIIQVSNREVPGPTTNNLVTQEINNLTGQVQSNDKNQSSKALKSRLPQQDSISLNVDEFQLKKAQNQPEINYDDCRINMDVILDKNDQDAKLKQLKATAAHENLRQTSQLDTRPEPLSLQKSIQKLKQGHSMEESYLENIEQIYKEEKGATPLEKYQKKQAEIFRNLAKVQNRYKQKQHIREDSTTDIINKLFPVNDSRNF